MAENRDPDDEKSQPDRLNGDIADSPPDSTPDPETENIPGLEPGGGAPPGETLPAADQTSWAKDDQ